MLAYICASCVGQPVQCLTRMSDGKQVTIGRLGSVDHGDVHNGSEDRPVDCPAGRGGRQNETYGKQK